MKIKTSELTDAALDWAVAKCEGHTACWEHDFSILCHKSYHLKWEHGGPIIEREGILLRPIRKEGHALDGQWLAKYDGDNTGQIVQWVCKPWVKRSYSKGFTPLISAMRCLVASKLGDEVEIPEELVS